MEVAFSRQSQPLWFRVLKYVVLGLLVYTLWGTDTLWIILPVLAVLSLSLHFWYRYKTKAWTQSYGGWKFHSKETGKNAQHQE